METTAIFVTYGARLEIARKSVRSILSDTAVKKVIVVDNGSNPPFSLDSSDSKNVRIVRNSENLGSAGGFDDGIKTAFDDESCSHVALFDDDNIIDSGSMQNIIDLYSSLGPHKVAIASLRINRPEYRKYLDGNIPHLLPLDGFLGFSITSKALRFSQKFLSSLNKNHMPVRARAVDVAPYGGLFASREDIMRSGGPDRTLYLYGDDHEFTRRMTDCGVTIYLSDVTTIRDIDESWDLGKSRTNPWIDNELPEWRRYFAARNRIILERKLARPIWSPANYWLLMCWLWIRAAVSYGRISQVRSAMRPLYEGLADARSHPAYHFEHRYRPDNQKDGN